MEKASFGYGKWHRRLQYFAIAFCIALFLSLSVASIAQAFFDHGHTRKWQGLLVLLLSIWALLGIAQWVRYRHFLNFRYDIESDGVRIGNEKGTRLLPWSSFESAEFLPAYSMLRLKSWAEARPIVLPLIRGGFEPKNADLRNALARRLVEDGMGRPLKKTWLW